MKKKLKNVYSEEEQNEIQIAAKINQAATDAE